MKSLETKFAGDTEPVAARPSCMAPRRNARTERRPWAAKYALHYIFVLLLSIGLLGTTEPTNAQSVEPVSFARPNVVSFHLHSQILGQPMLVEIMLPLSYGSDSERTYPVMYITDGLVTFPLLGVSNLLQGISYDPAIPEVITVGVDFIEIDSVRDFKRLDYYTPVQDEDEEFGLVGGKADQYIDFLNYELKPFIQAAFAVDTDREIFGGHSMGGLLSLYMLFTQPDSFDAYIAASPSIYWGNEVIFNYERDYFLSHPVTPTALFMSVGRAEDPWGVALDYVGRMAKKIRRRPYPAMAFKMKRFAGENHTSVIAPAFAKGARFVFRHVKSTPGSRETQF